MAIMATEQPQSLSVKLTTSPSDEPMVDDDSAVQAVNGHSESDKKDAESDEKPVVNGKPESHEKATQNVDDTINQKAFAANNNLDSTPKNSIPEPSSVTDTDMVDVNGSSISKDESTSPMEIDKADATEPSTAEETVAEAPAADQKSVPEESAADVSVPQPSADLMDVESSTDKLESSTDHPTVVKDEVKDKATDNEIAAAPSQDSSQPSTELSKLDIGNTQPDTVSTQTDTPMTDQPTSAVKVSREREEDGGDERVAKRIKTEAPADSSVAADASRSAPASNARVEDEIDKQAISAHHNRNIRTYLAGIKKTKHGLNFRSSVQKLWPGLWDDYSKKISNPVDISLFETKLREDRYPNYGALKADVGLLYENSVKFNGEHNTVTSSALSVRDSILAKLPEIYLMEEPAKPEKGKAQPTRHAEPRAATQPRRQSQPQVRAPASSPKPKPTPPAQASQQVTSSSSAQTFAIQPNGMPQIRRDSTREDGNRPKRPIHPPKNRDLDYPSGNRKKLEPEQRFFDTVLEEVKRGKHYFLNQWFLTPVDPVALNIPTYFSLVKKPMDLETMTRKNREGEYKNVKDFEKDMRLIVHNAELFNGEQHEVTILARRLEELFKSEVAKRDQWMKRYYPPETLPAVNASAPSPDRSARDSEEESEAEGDNEGSEVIRNLQGRLDEEQDKLSVLLGSKKPDLTMIEIQQSMVSMLQRKLVEERAKFHEEKKPKPKKKSSSKTKPKSGGGGATATTSKKSAGGNPTASKKVSGHGSHKKAAPKSRPIGRLEKAVIAEGINELEGNALTRAVEIIKRDTGQNENDDGEMELDIDALSSDALRRLYELIHKANPGIRTSLERQPEYSSPAEPEPKVKPSTPSKSKKNKPMNKHEQERKIEQLRELKAQLQRHGSGSQEPLPDMNEINRAADSSEEESDSEEE